MINKVILIGNVGTDPEVRTLESGTKIARIRLATTERITERASGLVKDITEWHSVIFWKGLAEVVDKYVRKGERLYVEGAIHYREWTDKNNIPHNSTEITAQEIKILTRRAQNNNTQGEQAPTQPLLNKVDEYEESASPERAEEQPF